MEKSGIFEARKRDHIQHSLAPDSQAGGTGADQIELIHDSLPDLDFEDLDLSSFCLGKTSRTPFFVAGMTAGHADAFEINLRLAEACQHHGWAMGVGSQRSEITQKSSSKWDQWKKLRARCPKLKIFSNLGISQLIHTPVDPVLKLVEALQADALAIHLNPLQEVIQEEGTPQFKGSVKALAALVAASPVPVIVKETGSGMSEKTLGQLLELGVAAVDVSGRGGTHWGRIEGARAALGSPHQLASETFRNWGVSTAESLWTASRVFARSKVTERSLRKKARPLGANGKTKKSGISRSPEVWASGGVRSGLDAAKWIALGAFQVGYAVPALRAALQGSKELDQWMSQQEFELKIALFCTGTGSVQKLRGNPKIWKKREN